MPQFCTRRNEEVTTVECAKCFFDNEQLQKTFNMLGDCTDENLVVIPDLNPKPSPAEQLLHAILKNETDRLAFASYMAARDLLADGYTLEETEIFRNGLAHMLKRVVECNNTAKNI